MRLNPLKEKGVGEGRGTAGVRKQKVPAVSGQSVGSVKDCAQEKHVVECSLCLLSMTLKAKEAEGGAAGH